MKNMTTLGIMQILDRLEEEYRKEPKQHVVAHGLFTIDRIRRELK